MDGMTEHRYQPFFCEENVWHLSQSPGLSDLPRRVVFISNPRRACPLFLQRASECSLEPVIWDYHVVLAVLSDGWRIWDLDSRLDLGVSLHQYTTATFVGAALLPPDLALRFRLVEADLYQERFRSGRAHMRGQDGRWLHPPPPWPAIVGDSQGSNLARFIDMEAEFIGVVTDLEGLGGGLDDTAACQSGAVGPGSRLR